MTPPAATSSALSASNCRKSSLRLAPKRQPHRKLALPRRVPRHQEHDHVAQSDQQDQPHHCHQHAQRLAVHLVVSGEALGILQAEYGSLLAGLRISQPYICRRLKRGLELRDRLGFGHAGRKASNQPQAPPGGVGDVGLAVFRRIAPRIQFDAALQAESRSQSNRLLRRLQSPAPRHQQW